MMTHIETCVLWQPKLPQYKPSHIRYPISLKAREAKKMTVRETEIHCAKNKVRYSDYNCVSLSLSLYICLIYIPWTRSPSKPNPLYPTSKTFFLSTHSLSFYSQSDFWVLLSILLAVNAVLMAALNSFLISFFFFIFSLLFHASLPVTSFHYSYRSLLSSMNCTASTNSTKHHHKWVGPIGHRVITVNVDGSGDFQAVQAAVDSVPTKNMENVVIQISAGNYM